MEIIYKEKSVLSDQTFDEIIEAHTVDISGKVKDLNIKSIEAIKKEGQYETTFKGAVDEGNKTYRIKNVEKGVYDIMITHIDKKGKEHYETIVSKLEVNIYEEVIELSEDKLNKYRSKNSKSYNSN